MENSYKEHIKHIESINKSIVLRGNIVHKNNNFITEVVGSIREWFDGELIISTWDYEKNNIPKNLNVDKILFSKDPGEGPVGNLKRQILSSKIGIENSTGEIILCSRTDILFQKNLFFEYTNMGFKNTNYKIFDKRILTCSHMSIHPETFHDAPEFGKIFRISDWFHLGYRKDIFKLMDILDVIDSLDKSYIEKKGWYQYKNCHCCEQFWNLCLIYKNLEKFDFCDLEKIKTNHHDYVCNNFLIKNTVSQLSSINKNWEFQPDSMLFYITHDKFLNYLAIQNQN